MASVKWKLQKTTDPQQALYTSGASKQIRLNPSALQEKSRTICCGLLPHREDVWVSETGLNIFQCSFPSAFLAPNSSRLLICLLLWLSLRANYGLVKNPFEKGVERQPSKMCWKNAEGRNNKCLHKIWAGEGDSKHSLLQCVPAAALLHPHRSLSPGRTDAGSHCWRFLEVYSV